MLYTGNRITIEVNEGIATLCFDAKNESVNKFDKATNLEFIEAVSALEAAKDIKGLIVTSAKKVFIAGADITEFVAYFKQSQEELVTWLLQINAVFNRFEDLPFPKVAAINGAALGGGCEMTLVCDYRVMAESAQIGLPETQLGIFPGFGGSVRAPRIIGVDNALEIIATGRAQKADDALKLGLVDAVVADEALYESALTLLKQCIEGKLDWRARHTEKQLPIKLSAIEQTMAFNSARGAIFAKANPVQYPAIKLAVDTIEAHANLSRDEAIPVEAQGFAKAATTPQAAALVGVFLNDQLVKKVGKKYEQGAQEVNTVAVLGAGIMGGGIAYQAAHKGISVVMKDIANDRLALGMAEAGNLLSKQVERGKLSPAKMSETLSRIRPTLGMEDVKGADVVIEAVTENPAIKEKVLSETESQLAPSAILASNTSTISISSLAKVLQRPENFVGMHFFNPVPKMPLVEIIRGEKTSDIAIATTVKLAQRMGKTPIVVNDCAGFFVNRVLFPYFGAFELLVQEGVDFVIIDKVMEKFGMPMGAAYLMDVVGLDTGVHAAKVMADAYPERMKPAFKGAVEVLYEHGQLGQKSGAGFYVYGTDKKGKPTKTPSQKAYELIGAPSHTLSDDEIVARMMVALCNEVVLCLDEGVIGSAGEADMALLMGIGFPAFRGGACRYIDQMGVANYVALCDRLAHLGKAYEAPALLKQMAADGKSFYA
ncbi:MAG: fatty acid oxidation complex subunit alpha FadB [Moraxella sp.]|nr:fatty acid oxidation complex subunit alpha FadB [Moraxella sp.]